MVILDGPCSGFLFGYKHSKFEIDIRTFSNLARNIESKLINQLAFLSQKFPQVTSYQQRLPIDCS